MNKSRLLFFFASLAVLLPVIAGSLSGAPAEKAASDDSLSKHLSIFSEVISLVRRAYVEETSVEEMLAGALDGVTDALDPLSTFVPAAAVESYRQARRVGRQHSGLTIAKDRGIAFVLAVDPESPGAKAGLEQGDIISQVDGRSTRRMPLWELQTLLASPPGTTHELEILHRGQSEQRTLTLGTYEIAGPVLEERSGLGVLRLRSFEQADLQPLKSILAQLVSADQEKLLIDVRGVAGGDAAVAYAMAGQFVRGTLGELRGRDQATLTFEGMEQPIWQGQTAILIDSGTQGAAEVFAAVMRQLAGSQLVGRRSFGHAGRQRMLPLTDGSQVLLTDAFYRGPDGKAIDRSLLPDVPVNELSRRYAEQDVPIQDLTLERGLELLQAPTEESDAEEVA